MPGGIATAHRGDHLRPAVDRRAPAGRCTDLICLGIGIFVVADVATGASHDRCRRKRRAVCADHPRRGHGLPLSPPSIRSRTATSNRVKRSRRRIYQPPRQLGGSFGIAVLATFLQSRMQFHRVDLLSNIYPTNPALATRQQEMTSALLTQGYPATAAQASSYALIDGTVMRQATMLSYNDCSWMSSSAELRRGGAGRVHPAETQKHGCHGRGALTGVGAEGVENVNSESRGSASSRGGPPRIFILRNGASDALSRGGKRITFPSTLAESFADPGPHASVHQHPSNVRRASRGSRADWRDTSLSPARPRRAVDSASSRDRPGVRVSCRQLSSAHRRRHCG